MKFKEYMIESNNSINVSFKQSRDIERNFGFDPAAAKVAKSKFDINELMIGVDDDKNIYISDPNKKHISKVDIFGKHDIISLNGIEGISWYRVL